MTLLAILKDIVQIGGRALQEEDEYISYAVANHSGEHGGLLRVELERYYQFVVWRSLLTRYSSKIELPREGPAGGPGNRR